MYNHDKSIRIRLYKHILLPIFRPKHRFNQVSQPNLPISPPLKPSYHTQASACSSRSSAARSSVSDFEEEEELDEDEFRFASESVSEMELVSMVAVVSIDNVGGCAWHWVIVGEIVDLVAFCLWLWVLGVKIGARFLVRCGFCMVVVDEKGKVMIRKFIYLRERKIII